MIPTIAHMGKGILKLFETVLDVTREKICPLPQPPTRHIADSLQALRAVIAHPEIEEVFEVPRALLLSQLAENDDYFLHALGTHFPSLLPDIALARTKAEPVSYTHLDVYKRQLSQRFTEPQGVLF